MSLKESVPPERALGGAIVHRLRFSHNYSQGKLADICYLSQGFICQIESGNVSNPGYRTILALAKALGVGLRFYEGIQDQRVFLIPEAHEIKTLLDIPLPDSKTDLSNQLRPFLEQLPTVEYPTLIYIEHLPSDVFLGRRIFDLRKRTGISQGQLAYQSRLNQGYTSQIEHNDVKNPSMRTLEGIANELKVSLEELLEIEEINVPAQVTAIDYFFRSEKVSPPDKGKFRQVLRFVLEKIKSAQAL